MSIRIKLGGAWPKWTRMVQGGLNGGAEEWRGVMDKMFDASQDSVHVITGQLKASGHVETTEENGRFVGSIEYDAPYAAGEAARGGPHDFMQRAYEATADEFEPAVQRALERMVERQFGGS